MVDELKTEMRRAIVAERVDWQPERQAFLTTPRARTRRGRPAGLGPPRQVARAACFTGIESHTAPGWRTTSSGTSAR